MSQTQFAVLLLVIALVNVAVLLISVIYAVERGLTVRWKSIKLDFDRLFMVSQGLDTLRETLIRDAEQSSSKIEKAVKVVELIKAKVEEHDREISRIKEHPLLRPLGGNGNVK